MDLAHFDEIYFQASYPFSLYEYISTDKPVDQNNSYLKHLVELNEYLISADDRLDISKLSPKKLRGLNKLAQYRFDAIEMLTNYCINIGAAPKFELAQKALGFLDSFNRPAYLIQLAKILPLEKWIELFVGYWSSCDGCSLYISELSSILSKINVEQVMRKHFSEEAYQEWCDLPDTITVYRGAFKSCMNGLSWSLDCEVAERFAKTYYDISNKGYSYLRAVTQINDDGYDRLHENLDEDVYIYKIEVNPRKCLLFTNRNESELLIPTLMNDDEIEVYAQIVAATP